MGSTVSVYDQGSPSTKILWWCCSLFLTLTKYHPAVIVCLPLLFGRIHLSNHGNSGAAVMLYGGTRCYSGGAAPPQNSLERTLSMTVKNMVPTKH